MNERKTEAMEVRLLKFKCNASIYFFIYRTGGFFNSYFFIQGFIDGDLIETFLDLGREKMAEVASATTIKDASGTRQEAKVEDLVKIVEDLTRIHQF